VVGFKINYHRWEEGLLHDISYKIMTEALKMDIYEVFFSPTDEMEILRSNLCDFIRNRYRDKIKHTYRLYKTKIGYIRI
jgi:hypothetical protein